MKSEELKKIKTGLLALIMCFNLSSCSEVNDEKKEEVQEVHEETIKQYKDSSSYLIVFIDGKAIIYEENAVYSTREGYAAISEDYVSMRFIQTPCVVLTGKDNCINFASEIVGEENVILMNFENGYDLILKPNN